MPPPCDVESHDDIDSSIGRLSSEEQRGVRECIEEIRQYPDRGYKNLDHGGKCWYTRQIMGEGQRWLTVLYDVEEYGYSCAVVVYMVTPAMELRALDLNDIRGHHRLSPAPDIDFDNLPPTLR